MLSKILKKKSIASFATKGILAVVLMAIFFAPLQGFAPVARAEPVNTPAGDAVANYAAANPNATTAQLGQANANATQAVNAAGPDATQAQQTQAASNAVPTSGPPINMDDAGCTSGRISSCISDIVYVFTVGFMSILAYIGGFIFDVGVSLSLQSVTYSQSFLTDSWAAVRDLANMAFIFLLVYLAIVIVLRAETSGSLKMLAGVIIAALLINFSFFITRVAIDAGNILATQFYNTIDAPSLAATAAGSSGANLPSQFIAQAGNYKDLTANIMGLLGVQTLLSGNSFSAAFSNSHNFLVNLIVFSFVYVAVGAILAMLAFTFITVGIKFLVRIVVLWFVIISSPLAFVAKALFSKNSSDAFGLFKRWQTALIQFSFYPAVFLFIFWIINTIAKQLSNCTAGTTANCGIINSAFSGLSGVNESGSSYLVPLASAIASVSVRLGLVVVMLYVAMKSADKIANTSIKAVDGFGNLAAGKLTGWTKPYLKGFATVPASAVTRTARGTVGLAYRGTVGAGANALNKKIQSTPSLNKKGEAFGINNALNRAAYGVRQGILTPLTNVKPLGAQSPVQIKEANEKREKDRTANVSAMKNTEDVKELPQVVAQIKPLIDREADADRLKAIDERLRDLVNLSTRPGGLTGAEVAERGVLSTERATLAPTVRTFTPAETAELTNAKVKIDTLKKNINDFSKAEIEKFKMADLTPIIKYMKESQLKKIEESDKFNEQEKIQARNTWHGESEDASLEKSQNIIKQLRQMNQTLKKSSVTLLEIDHAIGTPAMPVAGTTIDSTLVGKMRDEINDHISDIQAKIRVNAAGTNLKELNNNLGSLQRIQTRLIDKLDEERAKIPPGAVRPGSEARKFVSRKN